MKKVRQLTTMKQVTIYTAIATVSVFLCTIPCFFFDLMDVPLGILLGGFGSTLAFSLFTIKENSLENKVLMKLSILFVIIMALVHISTIVLAGCLYYVANIHVFNLFSTFAGSFIGLITFVIYALVSKKQER